MSLKSFKPYTFAFTLMLAGIAALPPLLTDMNLPAVPEIEQVFHTAPGQGSLTISLFLLGFSLAPIIGGPLSDSLGRKPLLVIALGMISATALGCALANSFRLLLVLRMLKGIACGFCMLMPLAIIRDTLQGSEVRRQHAKVMFIVGLAPLIAPILGGWLLALADWRIIYATQAGLALLDLAVISLFFGESLALAQRVSLDSGQLLRGFRALLGNSQYLGHALLVAFCFGCMFSYISGSPGLLIGRLKLSEQSYSMVFALTAMGLMTGSYLSGWLSRREVLPKPIIVFNLILLSLSVFTALFLALEHAVTVASIVPVVFLMMMSFALIAPNALSEAMDPVSNIAGTASGAANSMQMLVGATASAAVTMLAASVGPALAMTGVMACFVFLACGVYLGAGMLKHRQEGARENGCPATVSPQSSARTGR